MMAFRDPGMHLTWTMIKDACIPPRTSIYSAMMLYSRADNNNVLVSGERFLYTVPPFCL